MFLCPYSSDHDRGLHTTALQAAAFSVDQMISGVLVSGCMFVAGALQDASSCGDNLLRLLGR